MDENPYRAPREPAKPSRPDSTSDYSAAWGDYRRRRLVCIGATVAMALVGWIIVRLHPSDTVIIFVFTPFLVAWFASWFWELRWRCPRCGNLYFVRLPLPNPAAQRCLHCRLARWATDLA